MTLFCSHSDSEPVQAKAATVDLLPSLEGGPSGITEQLASAGDKDQLIAHLFKLVSEQHQMVSDLRSEQQRRFSSLEEQLIVLKTSVLEEQKAGLTELRILPDM